MGILGASFYFSHTGTMSTGEGKVAEVIGQSLLQAGVSQNALYTKVYTGTKGHFSFKYPESFNVRSFIEEDGTEILTVENKSTGEGFQIRIQETDDNPLDITEERIKNDIPDITLNDPQEVLLGKSGKGLAFVSDDPAFGGKSREVWFALDNTFYQISTYFKYDYLVKGMLETWEFK